MTDILVAPEDFDPKDRKENKNLQNGSEENTQDSNTEKQIPIRDPRLLSDYLNEEEQEELETKDEDVVVPTRDPSVWDHRSDEDEAKTDENNDQDKDSNNDNDVRDYRGSGKKLANYIRVQSQKQRKYDRLVSEMNILKADLKRGYIIVENDDGQINHIPLTSTKKEVISFKISDLDYERFMLRIEIQDIDQKIKKLANRKRTHKKTKKEKVAKSRQEDQLVQRVDKELTEASKNGSKKIVSQIQQQIQSGNKNAAYYSIKSFLSQQVKTVAKKLDKDEKLEKIVLDRVIDKLSASQS